MTKFVLGDYIAFRAAGIAAIRRSPEIAEFVFQSGVTSIDPVLFPQLRNIKRRRMADFIQDSMAAIALRFNKLPGTTERFDSVTAARRTRESALLPGWSGGALQGVPRGRALDYKSDPAMTMKRYRPWSEIFVGGWARTSCASL